MAASNPLGVAYFLTWIVTFFLDPINEHLNHLCFLDPASQQ